MQRRRLARHPLASDLTAMFVSFERQLPPEFHQQVKDATAAGASTVDLEFPMIPAAAQIVLTMTEMFDLADAFCRAERLLSTARTPRQRDFHTWLLNEMVRQLSGGAATPWQGSPPVDTSGSQPQQPAADAASQAG